jgi:hypothetical protein
MNEIPRNNTPRIRASQVRVMAAFRLRGSLKAVIPLEIASTPVRAVVPLENACRIRNKVIPDNCSPTCSSSGGLITVPREPVNMRNNPVPIVISMMTIKK